MPAIEFGLDPQTLKVIGELADGDRELLEVAKMKMKAQAPGLDNWNTATHFCERYDISRSTLARRVKAGKIEQKAFDDGIVRYRLLGDR